MKERPLLMQGDMVRATLAGTKTHTRRIVKGAALEWLAPGKFLPRVVEHPANEHCPFGYGGDRLWVREAWRCDAVHDHVPGSELGGPPPAAVQYVADSEGLRAPWGRYRHGRFMPRWASRITLEIGEVRVERLQDISEADAIAEGVAPDKHCRQDDDAAGFNRIGPVAGNSFPIARYAVLWESINGPGSWAANPWVWVVIFRRIKP